MEPTQLAQVRRLFEGHADRLVLYARTWADADGARDVVQEAFVRLMGVPAPDDPVAWLFRVVRNLAVTRGRTSGRHARLMGKAARDVELFRADPAAPLAARDAQAALEKLNSQEREIVLLHLYCGLSFETTGQIAGVSTATAFRTYRAALDRIRKTLEATCPAKKTP